MGCRPRAIFPTAWVSLWGCKRECMEEATRIQLCTKMGTRPAASPADSSLADFSAPWLLTWGWGLFHLSVGLERDKFDNKTVTFEEHIKEEHNMWHYLCFIVLVKVKDSTEYTGPESYVAEMIKVSRKLLEAAHTWAGTAALSSGRAARYGSQRAGHTAEKEHLMCPGLLSS